MQIIFNIFLNIPLTDFKGEVAALLAAGFWAVASVVYGRLGQRIPPLQLNLLKGIIAIALLTITIFVRREFFPILTIVPLSLLLLSGIVGIGLGDLAFLAAINSFGARRTLLMGTLAPPMTAIIAQIFLQEKLNVNAWCGILLTIVGVAWVVTERLPDSSGNSSTQLSRGIGFGLLAAIANAIGGVLSRAALANTSIPPLWASLFRLIAGVLILLPLVWLSWRRGRIILSELQSTRVIIATFFAAFCGTYLGIWLQQTAIKFTPAGIALTLLQTSPLFIMPLAICMGEKVSFRAIAGVVIAIAGIALLFYLR
ncbi:MAG: DMT family transporter [Tolypothrix carrinoi HA7290-LM1]|nr:DMT family transporter [Tolypothrix carrinoi HA7290-LM1]